jgi:hypothetical protein
MASSNLRIPVRRTYFEKLMTAIFVVAGLLILFKPEAQFPVIPGRPDYLVPFVTVFRCDAEHSQA